MVEPQAGVARPAVSHVVPERIDALVRMERTNRVGPAMLEQACECGAALRLHQRVLVVGFGGIDIALGRHDVVIADQNDRHAFCLQRRRMRDQPVEPCELVVEFRAGLRVTVRSIEASDENAVDRSLDVAALVILRIAGQRVARQHGLHAAREDRHPIPRFLATPNRLVTGPAHGISGKIRVGALELLQAHDVRPRGAQPGGEVRQPLVDVVDVEGRDLHAGSCADESIVIA